MGTRTRKRELVGGSYDWPEVLARIEKTRLRKKFTVKSLCEAARMAHYDYSRKIRRDGSTFTLPEISAIGAAMECRIGWPWVSDDLLDAIEARFGDLPTVKPPEE